MITSQQIQQAKILIIDDQEISIRLLNDILTKAGFQHIYSTVDPRESYELYEKIQPDLLILDIHMPHLNGFEVMQKLKEIDPYDYLPIIVLSNEENKETHYQALESGAKDFLNKPFDRVEVLIRIRNIIEVRMLHNEVRNQNILLDMKVKERTEELRATQLDVVQRLARAVEFRDSETGSHIIRMSRYSECLAAEAGMNDTDTEMILTASPLHDIGKIGIPDAILQKPGKLDSEEWKIMMTHTTIGNKLLSGNNSKFISMAQEIALNHHEKWDGSGYPQGIKCDDIPLVGRICGLTDVFDALTSKRPYKRAWTIEEAVEEIRNCKGKHFDPHLVDCFLKILPKITEIYNLYDDE